MINTGSVAGNWQTVRMSDICVLHYGKPLTGRVRRLGTVPVYGSNGPTGWHDTPLTSGPTVILGRKGQGPLGVEWVQGPFWVIDTAYYTTFSSAVEPKFFYYFTDMVGLNHLKDGTSNPSLTREIFGIQDFPMPPLEEQREIASLLTLIDDKIGLNRKTAATLEEMARALYRSWFVDFDPVYARAEGCIPAKMDAATASLFPDSFGEDGLPRGWLAGTLDYYARLNPTAYSKKNHPQHVEYVDLANTKWGHIEATTEYAWDDAPSRARMMLKAGDTIVGTVRPGNGSYSYIGRDGLTGSTGFAVLRSRDPMDSTLVYTASTDPETIDDLANLADGGAYPAVRPDVVATRPVCIVPTDLRQSFAKIVTPLMDRIEATKLESCTLATLRDTLLPRLMSGKLRVDGARDIVEDVA